MSQLMYATVGGLVAAGLVVIAPAQPRAGQPSAASAGGATCATSGCHLRVTQHQQVHQPVAEHQCEVCHVPKERSTPLQAGVRHEFRRAGDDPEVCYACHDRLGEDDFVHEPVKMGVCILCHDPHGAERASLLRVDTDRQMCELCHRETFDRGDYIHGPVSTGTCLACHDPHGSKHQKFLAAEPMGLCLSCHDKELDSDDGTIRNIAAYLASNPNHHGPIKDRNCVACHNPHGGSVFRLLALAYPQGNYAAYDEDRYALCLDCHDVEMVEEERDEEATEFRNGDLNLHYVHVNRDDKGSTCGACHDVHAGKGPKHIADPVYLGQQAVLIGFEATATGGSCTTPCHATWAYDRVDPVKNE